jgi:hypothetical protein
VGMAVNLPPWLFFYFLWNLLHKHSAAPHFNKLQYLTDGDIGKFTWFQEMTAQMPKS